MSLNMASKIYLHGKFLRADWTRKRAFACVFNHYMFFESASKCRLVVAVWTLVVCEVLLPILFSAWRLRKKVWAWNWYILKIHTPVFFVYLGNKKNISRVFIKKKKKLFLELLLNTNLMFMKLISKRNNSAEHSNHSKVQ